MTSSEIPTVDGALSIKGEAMSRVEESRKWNMNHICVTHSVSPRIECSETWKIDHK